ncbi:chaB [Sucra jujuba nucleopolyhedrovirus]|uniref:ChaB n=1 Tax=Sucra jujuba nucleopolyhedrovirus TaxID=1563660 RepID=A0A097P908_9ABAC|nr:chaB [Sucra jujuba nucleopolyhedrovirus]AIU41284.1 chaB [Sucra jujuba nucleopolyhedrovirus]
MDYLVKAQFKDELPARAKRLYLKTFSRYHKMNGGDEDVALHLAQKAVEKNYVKLNDRWYPKAAAEHIVRHDMDTSDDSETNDDDLVNYKPVTNNFLPNPNTLNDIDISDYEQEHNEDNSLVYQQKKISTLKRNGTKLNNGHHNTGNCFRYKSQKVIDHNESSDSTSSEIDDEY